MRPIPSGTAGFALDLASEDDTRRLAVDVANLLEPGDFVALWGDLGVGKTALVRAIIGHLAGDATIEVPSPTFTLVQNYDLPRFTVLHADLYRLSGPDELAELGIDDRVDAVVMMEWPDRACRELPDDRIEITLSLGAGVERRIAHLVGRGIAAGRVARLGEFLGFLDRAGYGAADRSRIAGDASSRSYERVARGPQRLIVMNAPRKPDGPPVKRGLPYSAIAHLAEDVNPFIAMANGLGQRGFSAPRIIACAPEAGFILLEDLGDALMVAGAPPGPIEERYTAAVDVLLALHRLDLPDTLPVAPGTQHRIPGYDLDALLIEVELLLDWYLPYCRAPVRPEARAHFQSLWRDALRPVMEAPKTWVLRDYHSPNLLWLAEREGIARVGLLDFQDAVMGPAAYDVASLLQDARVDVPEALELALLGRYVHGRRDADPGFDATGFARLYATLAAQRATKILGIFARLERRDGKPQYVRHLPRVFAYLRRALAHPGLAALGDWYTGHVPPPA